MLCSHKKRTIFSHCEQLVRSLLVLHSPPDGNRMAVSGILLGRRSPWSFWHNPFWCISEPRSWLRTPESQYPLFGIFDGGHGELRRISPTLCTRIINHGLRTP
ncbi:hypothetical protein V8C43DRAFT_319205 [Trichoderma afarasin]